MHKGRPYPFSPIWWFDTAHFWPGYAPWKCIVEGVFFTFPDWFPFLPFPTSILSDPAEFLDVNTLRWHFTVDWTAAASDFTISSGRVQIGTTFWNRWHAQILLAGVPLADAYLFVNYPSSFFGTLSFPWGEVDAPGNGVSFNYIDCRPARYAEGGSPWP